MGTELVLSAGAPSVCPLSLPSDSSTGATSHTRNNAQGHCEKQQNGSTQGRRHRTTVGMFPDNVLLEIFDFYRKNHDYTRSPVWEWHLLAHVCKAWRQIVFSSPRQLDLKILCTYGIPVRENLGIWPAFPIIILYESSSTPVRPNDEDNIVHALEHCDRVCDIELSPGIPWNSRSEKFDAVVQQPFPVLTRLYIDSVSKDPSILPANFLGGSAPRLQEITLSRIPYPALPVLLLSASDLVKLNLRSIPLTGYISPEAMVASLATLSRLDHLTIGFQSVTPLPDRIRPPPATRIVLPALTSFEFWGTSEYLEDLISHIDSPQLNQISIEYLRLVDYQITELSKFIDRSVGPKLTLSMHASVRFFSCHAFFSVYRHVNRPSSDCRPPEVRVSCGVDWHASDIAQLLSHFRTPRSDVVHLDIEAGHDRIGDMTDVDWLDLLHQFSTMQTLRLDRGLAEHVALALEDIPEELVAEVLPSLELVYIVDQPASSVENFIAARRLSGRPVTVVNTETEFNERRESYVRR